MENMKALYIIVNAGYAQDVIEITREMGAGGATILNARGSAPRHEVFMGITLDTEKEIVLCLTAQTTAQRIMEAVKQRAGVGTPVHGVCFTTPVDSIIGLNIPQDR